MPGDLHIYTTHSVGEHSVAEVLLRAKECGQRYMAVTDRNTVEGVAEAQRLGLRLGITVISGVEIETHEPGSPETVCLLGYGFSFPAARIAALCERARNAELPETVEAVAAIHGDGGFAVLAHRNGPKSASLIERLASAGLDGVELSAANRDTEDGSIVEEAARRNRLFVTGVRCDADTLRRLTARGDDVVQWAEALVREAGRMARQAVLSEPQTHLKDGDLRDLVTRHDMEIDRFLIDSIRRRFPDDAFVTEEHDHPPADDHASTWIIDPIDGTTNFVTSRDYFAVSVAHYRGAQPVFGIVYDVMADQLYLGIAGSGAYLNGQPLMIADLAQGVDQRASPPMEESVIECSLICSQRLAERYGADISRLATGFRAQRANGCASIGICRVARGTLDIYVSCSLALWDYAAAAIVLAEAGGITALGTTPNDANRAAARHQQTAAVQDRGLVYHADRRVVVAAADERAVRSFSEALFPRGGPYLTTLRLGR